MLFTLLDVLSPDSALPQAVTVEVELRLLNCVPMCLYRRKFFEGLHESKENTVA